MLDRSALAVSILSATLAGCATQADTNASSPVAGVYLVHSGADVDAGRSAVGDAGIDGGSSSGENAEPGNSALILPEPTSFQASPLGTPACFSGARFASTGRVQIHAAAFAADGKTLALSGEASGANVWLWDAATGSTLRLWQAHARTTYRVAFSPDGTLLATAGTSSNPTAVVGDAGPDPDVVKIWRAATGELIRSLPATCGPAAFSVAFSHAGDLIATSGEYGNVEVWQVSTGALVTRIAQSTSVYSATFSPDDTLLVTAALDKTAQVWRVSDGAALHTLSGHTSAVSDAEFSRDGTEIATTTLDDMAVRVFSADGSLQQTLLGHKAYLSHVVWLDQNRLVTNDWSGDIKLWVRGENGFESACDIATGRGGSLALATDRQGNVVFSGGGGIWEGAL